MHRWNQRPTVFGQDPQAIEAGMTEYFEHIILDLNVQIVRLRHMVHAEPENDQLPLILQDLLAVQQAVTTEKRRREMNRENPQ